jgi:hypothetical protein
MSLSKQEIIKCTYCGNEQLFVIWSSINVTVDPSLREQLLDGSIVTFNCSNCNKSIHIENNVLYHDMDKYFAIWLKYPGENGSSKVDDLANPLVSILPDNYLCRRVESYQELVEKILILEDGYDDYAIELLKLFICIRDEIDITYPFYYHKSKKSLLRGKLISFIIPEEDDFIERIYSARKDLEAVKPYLTQINLLNLIIYQKFPYVNREYLFKLLQLAGLFEKA